MKCVFCRSEDIQAVNVQEELRVENDIVYVPVRVPTCHACGERYYDRQTMRFLEQVEQKLTEKRSDLKEIGKVLLYS